MDPGTALGIADMVCSSSKALYKYAKGLKGYETDIVRLQEHLNWLYDLFKAVEKALQLGSISDSSRKLLQDALLRCRRDALQLSKLAERVKPRESDDQMPKTKTMRSRMRQIDYPFKKPTITEMLDQVRACQNQLTLARDFLQIDSGQLAQQSLDGMTTKLSRIEQASRNAEDVAKAQRIIKSLQFESSSLRRSTIKDAQAETFRWIFHERVLNDDESESETSLGSIEQSDSDDRSESEGSPGSRKQSGADADNYGTDTSHFATWLKEDGDVFWVRGKAGSGKSTLMKSIVDNHVTRRLLRQWVDNHTLIVADHFFWIAGDVLQKSKHGMLRNLLYQILDARPLLVRQVCPDRWASDSDAAAKWSTSELMETLRLAAQLPDVRLCLFVDGLDECDPETEHKDLVDDVFRLAAHDHLKIVVSSRPWPVFDRCLALKDTILALEDLTRRDMLEHMRAEFTKHSRGQISADMDWSYSQFASDYTYTTHMDDQMGPSKRLVLEILDKADGVFLWVSIVVDNLCQQLSALRPLILLRKYVDGFPAKLEDYFRTLILDRVHDTWLSETAIMLQSMTLKYNYYREWDPHYAIAWMLSQEGTQVFNDARFYTRNEFLFPVASSKTICDTVKTFVASCCKDLLHVHKMEPRVLCLHRTVLDFLNTKEMQQLLCGRVPAHFNESDIAIQLELMSIKAELASEGALSREEHTTRMTETVENLIVYYFGKRMIRIFPSDIIEELARMLLRPSRRQDLLWRSADSEDIQKTGGDLPSHSSNSSHKERRMPCIGHLVSLLIDRNLNSLALELLNEIQEDQTIPLDLSVFYIHPLLVAFGTGLDGHIVLRDIDNPLLQKLLITSPDLLEMRSLSMPDGTPWQVFLYFMVLRSSAGPEYVQAQTVDVLRLLLPFTRERDEWVVLREGDRSERWDEIVRDGPFANRERATSMEILEALLSTDDFEAIRADIPGSTSPVHQVQEQEGGQSPEQS